MVIIVTRAPAQSLAAASQETPEARGETFDTNQHVSLLSWENSFDHQPHGPHPALSPSIQNQYSTVLLLSHRSH